MHPMKAEILASLDESSATVDEAMRRNFRVLASPLDHGGGRLAVALALIPLWAVSAILGDLSYVMVSRTGDDVWERLPPRDAPSE